MKQLKYLIFEALDKLLGILLIASLIISGALVVFMLLLLLKFLISFF